MRECLSILVFGGEDAVVVRMLENFDRELVVGFAEDVWMLAGRGPVRAVNWRLSVGL